MSDEKVETETSAPAKNGWESAYEKILDNRSEKAVALVLSDSVRPLPRKGALVKGSRDNVYYVTEDFCTCPDFQYRKGVVCKHVRAYRIYVCLLEAERESEIPFGE